MIRPMHFSRLAAAALVSLALVACGSQKQPAQKALADLDAALSKVEEIGQKYKPQEYTDVKAEIAGLQSSFDGGDFKAVVAGAPKAAAAVRRLQADAIIARADFAKQMNAEWVEFAKTMPQTIVSVDRRIEQLSRGRLPKGVTRDAFKQAVAAFDGAKKAWAEAGDAGNAGKFEDAVMQARKVKETVDATKQTLGMKG